MNEEATPTAPLRRTKPTPLILKISGRKRGVRVNLEEARELLAQLPDAIAALEGAQ